MTLHATRAERSSFAEIHLADAYPEGADSRVARRSFDGLVERVAAQHVQLLHEKVYGTASDREELLALRNDAFRARGMEPPAAVTFLDGAPPAGAGLAGWQAWGIVPGSDGAMGVSDVAFPMSPPGRLWTWGDTRLLLQPAVRGIKAGGELAGGTGEQAAHMFRNANAGLVAHGFSYPDVARTWIYVARILDWYGELNGVRTEEYATFGVGPDTGGVPFPASTGIQGRAADEECLMDLLAVDPGTAANVAVRPITRSPRQDSAFCYGSSFSRGVVLESEGRKTFLISGTAAIDAEGRSVHTDSPEAQTVHTLLNIAALLEEQGGTLSDLVAATVFCKTADVYETFRETTRLLGLGFSPVVPVIADVCRSDLWIEIEAVAVI